MKIISGVLYMEAPFQINVFLLCYNESALLPHTIKHYKKYMPSCFITIFDNESTDNSVEIAKSFGCQVVSWNSNNILDDYKQAQIKNNCWKHINHGWIVMADMDEFLCVTENDLKDAKKEGITMLRISGIDMIGESSSIDLEIDLQKITKYIDNDLESKNLCFYRPDIEEMNYSCGAHHCNPVGNVEYSSAVYHNKHMSSLGLNFSLNKMKKRYERSHLMRDSGMATHYTIDEVEVIDRYNKSLRESKTLLCAGPDQTDL